MLTTKLHGRWSASVLVAFTVLLPYSTSALNAYMAAMLSADPSPIPATMFSTSSPLIGYDAALERSTCEADVGSLVANAPHICFNTDTVNIGGVWSAYVVPEGYIGIFLLTTGPEQLIVQGSFTPAFNVGDTGVYTIHPMVFDPATLDLAGLVFGQSILSELNVQMLQGGGTVCASLDMVGASIVVQPCSLECDARAGSLQTQQETICFDHMPILFEGTLNGDTVLPPDFTIVYLLTSGSLKRVQEVNSLPSFLLGAPGAYNIHTLVYDPAALDLATIIPGVTFLSQVNVRLIQGGGTICAALDLIGASLLIEDCRPANDDCMQAIGIPVGLSGQCSESLLLGDNRYATSEIGEPQDCEVEGGNYADVWYTFNSGGNTEISIVLGPISMSNWGLSVTDLCSGGSELACEVNPAVPIDVSTTPYTNYLIRIYSNTNIGNGGAFALCLTGAVATAVCDAGEVSADTGVEVDICKDGASDVINFTTTSLSTASYAYVVSDTDNRIVLVLSGTSEDFDPLPVGSYRVWGISYDGPLQNILPGTDLEDLSSAGFCSMVSAAFVGVNVEICSGMSRLKEEAWAIFPNPSNGNFSLRAGANAGLLDLALIALDGRVVVERTLMILPDQEVSVPLAGRLSPGLYILRLSVGGMVREQRVSIY